MAATVSLPDLPGLPRLLPTWLPPSAELPRDPMSWFDVVRDALQRVRVDVSRREQVVEDVRATQAEVLASGIGEREVQVEDVWERAGLSRAPKPTILSWDTTASRPTPFLSHNPHLFPAAQRKVLAIPKVTQELDASEVAEELRMVSRGYSGRVWVWREEEARFGRREGEEGEVWVRGYTPAASASLIARFLTTGTLLRRLDSVPLQLLTHPDPSYHAFSHALRQVLSHVRTSLDRLLSSSSSGLVGLHAALDEAYYTLTPLAELLGLDDTRTPPFAPPPPDLLKCVYSALALSMARSAPREQQAVWAYVWSEVSRPSLRALERCLGFGPGGGDGGEGEEKGAGKLEEVLEEDVRRVLRNGRRSRGLLKEVRRGEGRGVGEGEVRSVWSEDQDEPDRDGEDGVPPAPILPTTSLDPFMLSLSLPAPPPPPPNPYTTFLHTHPRTLASSLPLLTTLSLSPLLTHSRSLSLTLLHSLLPPLLQHLSTVSQFFHVRSWKFAGLVGEALFRHPSPEVSHGRGVRARMRARVGIADDPGKGRGAQEGEWAAVGLGVGMSERGAWPPGGAELGVVLRRVVIDSLEGDEQGEGVVRENWGEEGAVRERVGFVIRELEEGDESWLDPLRIEALDFLELQYKVPPPLRVVLDPQAMYKHKRIFSFLLRLLRVDIVVRDMFHPAHHTSLFPSSPAATHLLCLTVFKAQAFVSSLVGYIYDTALGSPWSTFTSRLRSLSSHPSSHAQPGLEDIFALASLHHSVIDSMLEGCFLRSGQRRTREALMGVLGTVLRLGQIVLDRRRGTVGEQSAREEMGVVAGELEEGIRELAGVLKGLQGLEEGEKAGGRGQGSVTERGADLWLRLNLHGYY